MNKEAGNRGSRLRTIALVLTLLAAGRLAFAASAALDATAPSTTPSAVAPTTGPDVAPRAASPATAPSAATAPGALSPITAPSATTAPSGEPLVFDEGPADPGTGRVGGGARGASDGPNVFLLVSQRVGRTMQEQPTIFWFLTAPSEADIDLVIARPGQTAPVYRKRLKNAVPLSAGLHAISLAGSGVKLEAGVRYQVTVTVWNNADDPSENPFSTGYIERVAVPAALARAGPTPGARACASAGLWYDALDALARETAERPADPVPRRQRRELLLAQHVFLTFSPPKRWEQIDGIPQAARQADKLEQDRLDQLARQDEAEMHASR